MRRSVLLNAAAAAMLITCVIAPGSDPLGTLPSYLGVRQAAHDVRAKTNLNEAITAMNTYRTERGTYEGIDAEAGGTLAPELAWSDSPTGDVLVV